MPEQDEPNESEPISALEMISALEEFIANLPADDAPLELSIAANVGLIHGAVLSEHPLGQQVALDAYRKELQTMQEYGADAFRALLAASLTSLRHQYRAAFESAVREAKNIPDPRPGTIFEERWGQPIGEEPVSPYGGMIETSFSTTNSEWSVRIVVRTKGAALCAYTLEILNPEKQMEIMQRAHDIAVTLAKQQKSAAEIKKVLDAYIAQQDAED